MASTDLVRVDSTDARPYVRAAGELAALGLREATTSIEAVHVAVARRAFATAPGGLAKPLHDVITAGVYASVRAGVQVGARAAGFAAAATAERWTPGRERSGAHVRGALNGAFGDTLARSGSALALPMTVRVDGADVALTRADLTSCFPGARSRVAVFVHGLCESELAWLPESPQSFGSRLDGELGITPVFVRFNSGLPIAENGALLDALVTALVAEWPVPVADVTLVGHSMGGLIARSSIDHAARSARHWVTRVGSAVYLGTPHGGAPLEKGARLLSTTLARAPETRPLAAAMGVRSAGIRDLGDGICADAHLPLADGISHHTVAATLGPTPDSLVSVLLGDVLVRHGSAVGLGHDTREALAFLEEDVHHLPSASHFDLLTHPAVYERLHAWLSPRAITA